MNKLSITQRCGEIWENMKSHDLGKSCSICSTTVVDFTGMTNDEIYQYTSANSGSKICGKYRIDQVEQEDYTMVHYGSQFSLKALVLGAAFSSLLSFDMLANTEHVLGGDLLSHGNTYPIIYTWNVSVVDLTYQTGIPFATLTLYYEGLEIQKVYTSLIGEGTFNPLVSDGSYSIKVEKEGYLPQTIRTSRDTWRDFNTIKLIKKSSVL